MGIAHIDEVQGHPPASATSTAHGRSRLGRGLREVGVRRIRVEPGAWSTPAHEHGEEEIFYVLGGRALVAGQAADVRGRPRRLPRPRRGRGAAHAERRTRRPRRPRVRRASARQGAWLPRPAPRGWASTWGPSVGEAFPWEREAAAGAPELTAAPSPRPTTIVNADAVAAETRDGATVARSRRDLATAAGAVRTGLKRVAVQPGKLGVAPHCHSAEEEIFVVLEGSGDLILGEDEHPVRTGHVVARPPATGVAHTFRAGLTTGSRTWRTVRVCRTTSATTRGRGRCTSRASA